MKWLVRAIVAALALVLVLGVSAIAYVWLLGAELLDKGRAAGWVAEEVAAPMNTFEDMAAKAMFARTWNRSGFPCRTVSRRIAGTGDRMPVSELVARDMLIDVDPERSLPATLAQLSAACQLEVSHSDIALLRLWLSRLPLARWESADAAAQALFGKPASQLNESESVRLVALFSVPSAWRHPNRWNERADYLMGEMQQFEWVNGKLERMEAK